MICQKSSVLQTFCLRVLIILLLCIKVQTVVAPSQVGFVGWIREYPSLLITRVMFLAQYKGPCNAAWDFGTAEAPLPGALHVWLNEQKTTVVKMYICCRSLLTLVPYSPLHCMG